jgi:ribose transport system substrate-binding protein
VKNALFLAVLGTLFLVGCGSDNGGTSSGPTTSTGTSTASAPTTSAGGKKKLAFITNNISDYWIAAKQGVEKAKGELPNYDIQFKEPSGGTAPEQKEIIDDLVTDGVVGIAISPVNPDNQTPEIDDLCKKIVVVTQDSDAPNSQRACYIGTDNTAAGEMAGQELMKALPNGGKVMVFVGSKDAANAKERFDGLKKAVAGSKITIVDERTDDTDRARAKQNVADAMTSYPDLAACVGLWSYNGPAIYNAVKEANKVGKVQIVCFDTEDDTVAGLKAGAIYATIVQQPFIFGEQSMLLLAKIVEGDKSGIPADKRKIIPTRAVTKATIDDYLAEQKKLTGGK